MKAETVHKATQMLGALLEGGATYRQAATRFGVGSSTVERQVKALLRHVARVDGLPGIDDPALASLQLLRHCAVPVMGAVRAFDPAAAAVRPRRGRVDLEDLAAGASRLRRLSGNPQRDVALLYVLFCTGAKPIEIARLEVRDYLSHDGSVRAVSELRAEAAARGRPRSLYFHSTRACAAIDAYLHERTVKGHGVRDASDYRGLDPRTALFLTEAGRPFELRRRNTDGRPSSPALIAAYRTIFTRAGWIGVTAQSARNQVACRLADRGADAEQVRELLGLAHLSSVKRLLRRPAPPLETLVKDLA